MADAADPKRPLPQPHDVVAGIPDRAAHRPWWKYVLVGAAFLAWLAVLVGLFLAGEPT